MPRWTTTAFILLGTLAGLIAWTTVAHSDVPTTGKPTHSDGKATRQVAVSTGAAPGYVDDQLCASCHRDLAESFQAVGMSRSFYPPSAATVIEDFDAPAYFHEPSQRYYTMRRDDGGTIRFRRHQLDDAGNEINAIEQTVDWILGSGHRSRTYLVQTPAGALFQLPLAWYTQDGIWRMAPGFDNREHSGINRPVQHECMFCHNAYPSVPTGADAYLQPHRLGTDLPHGIGCQRCHGPGGQHVQYGYAEQVDFKALAASIVNPAELTPERQRDVCYQCHMQPSVALMGIRRFGRNIYSYRPGEALADYLALVDVEEEGRDQVERFEINHHPYRLEQSACFQQSDGALSCLTCHDPHRKVPVEARVAHYRQACVSCHQLDDCTVESMAERQKAHGGSLLPPAYEDRLANNDCAGCHMPQHRTQDVVHAVMTDHRITRGHDGEALVAPRVESTPIITDARLMDLESTIDPALGEVYRAITVLRAGGGADAGAWLGKKLAESGSDAFEPLLDLGRWRLRERRYAEAANIFRQLLARRPNDAVLMGFLAIAEVSQGNQEKGLAFARESVQLDPSRAEAHFNLGRLLVAYDQPEAGIAALRQAVDLRPNLTSAWYHLSDTLARQGQPMDALEGFRQALRIDPAHTRSYLGLGRLLAAAGKREEALRYLRHGARVAADPAALADTIAAVEALPSATAKTAEPQ